MLEVSAIPALQDNYIWMLHRNGCADVVVVDPGDAGPVLEALSAQNLQLAAILITHHHWDHTSGIDALYEAAPVPVFGPAAENFPIPHLSHPLRGGDRIEVPGIHTEFDILEIPGHTAGHIAFVDEQRVFSGDTLFSAGCGRLFEGTAAQMHDSLMQLAQLGDAIEVYCGHEYTAANLRFAATVEPDNSLITKYIKETSYNIENKGISLPSTIAVERRVNPFLRCAEAMVIEAASEHAGKPLTAGSETFAELRRWKDAF